jgi:hypothetical protein
VAEEPAPIEKVLPEVSVRRFVILSSLRGRFGAEMIPAQQHCDRLMPVGLNYWVDRVGKKNNRTATFYQWGLGCLQRPWLAIANWCSPMPPHKLTLI